MLVSSSMSSLSFASFCLAWLSHQVHTMRPPTLFRVLAVNLFRHAGVAQLIQALWNGFLSAAKTCSSGYTAFPQAGQILTFGPPQALSGLGLCLTASTGHSSWTGGGIQALPGLFF